MGADDFSDSKGTDVAEEANRHLDTTLVGSAEKRDIAGYGIGGADLDLLTGSDIHDTQ